MSTKRLTSLLVLVSALIAACSSEPLPEAVDVAFDCRDSIEQLSELPDGYLAVLDRVAFPETELHQQGRSEEIEAGSGVFWRFSKMGLLIKEDAGFTIRVADESRGNALISWSNTGSPGPVEGLTTEGCSGDEAWLVYPGGVWVIEQACVTLTVETDGDSETVELPIAKTC